RGGPGDAQGPVRHRDVVLRPVALPGSPGPAGVLSPSMEESAAVPARTVELPRPDTSLHDTGPDTVDLGRARRQRHLLEHWGFTSHSHLLEIGCGVGRLAYELSGYLADDGRYVGFDVKEKAVEWLNTRYAPHLPNFQFDHFDVANVRYRPGTGA